MRLDNKKIKYAISFLLIVAVSFSTMTNFAGQFVGKKYIDDNGQAVFNQWRWIDVDGDGIAECYRFDVNGNLVTNKTMPDGKHVNGAGQWDESGIVQRVYYATMKPLGSNSYQYYMRSDITATASRVNASGKDLDKIAEDKKGNKKKQYDSPNIKETEELKEGEYLGKTINKPKADSITGQVINTVEEAPQYDDGSVRKVAGKSMNRFVSASKNFTKEVENVKIYGGEIWDKCMCFAGHESYAKFTINDNNYMQFEVAHQAHGQSTADTYCYLVLSINGEEVDVYEDFVDSEPLIVEEWFDEGDKTVELKWMVPEGSQGRKMYVRNAVFRKIKDKGDD